jgi:hypothetical protein
MKVRVIIIGAAIFVLGLAIALLSIHAAQLGAGPDRWLLYFSFGNMVVGLALVLSNFSPFRIPARRD